MKEEWLMPGAVVPVDAETTAALVSEIKRLIGIVGDLALRQALAQPEQEPETVMAKYEFQTYAAYKTDGEMKIGVVPEHTAWVTAGKHTVPLYTAPPKREWVGLEDEDVATVKNEFNRGALWAEAKLKEKNT